jgi:hypothetical protein
MKRAVVVSLAGAWLLGLAATAHAQTPSPEDVERRLEQLQKEMNELKQQMEMQKKAPPPPPPPTVAPAPVAPVPGTPATVMPPPAPAPVTTTTSETLSPTDATADRLRALLDAVRIGGYGSVRFEANNLDNAANTTFTYRRFVLSGDARIAPPLRVGFEIELERFTELELESSTSTTPGGGASASQTVEGTNETELSLEQAWLEWEFFPWLKYRVGMLLVPLGRFNLNHDDNRWNIARRPLVDRGVPVLPAEAAWSEVGMGFLGDIDAGRAGVFDYHLYVMNGVALNTSIESSVATRSGDTTLVEVEAEVSPSRGTAGLDVKSAKAVGGRLGWTPIPGMNLGGSFYYGRYSPQSLPSEPLYAFGLDGLLTLGRFELEGEYIYTHYAGVKKVANAFAQQVINSESEAESGNVETEVSFNLSSLADTKQGYWLEGRYRFSPDWLRFSLLGRQFPNPQLIPVVRWEQAFLTGLLTEVGFSDGVLTSLQKQNRFVNRITGGIAYRPTPLVVFQLAYEYTWTNKGQSLSNVTNFIPAQPGESKVGSLLFGAAFGF